MSNLTDALIAAKLVGGSGGSGGGSGLPEIKTEMTAIFPQTTLSFTDEGGIYTATLPTIRLSGAQTSAVSWDGADYECDVIYDDGHYVIGNLSLAGMGPDTGEPFCITDGFGADMVASPQAGPHTLTISVPMQSPKDGSIPIVENATWATAPLTFNHTMVADGTSDADVRKIASDYLPIVVQALGNSLCFYFSNETENGGVVSRWYYGFNYDNGGFTQEDMYIEIAAGGVTTMHTRSQKFHWDDDWTKSGDTWVFDAK